MENKFIRMKIGVTLNIKGLSLFSNGVQQNAVYLATLLANIGYSVDLLCGIDNIENLLEIQSIAGPNIKCIEYNNSKKNRYDVIITVGLVSSKNDINNWKIINPDLKVVYYKCGNEFFIDLESVIYNIDIERIKPENIPTPDQIWSIPQMENTNLDYYSFINRQTNATVVPFIWSPINIDLYAKKHNIGVYDGRNISRIGIMEPNMSIMKNYLIPSAIVETYYEKHSNIEVLRIFSGSKLKDNKRVSDLFDSYKLYKDRKISLEKRQVSILMLDRYIDCIVSWQIENNLNYLYLDAAWYGYPVLHNANMCKDIGYYYESNKIYEASDQLEYVINTHPGNNEYISMNRNLISRYMPNNKKLQEQYKSLIEDLINGVFNKRTYSCETNSIS